VGKAGAGAGASSPSLVTLGPSDRRAFLGLRIESGDGPRIRAWFS
jgi:hypothetical protein